MNLRRSIQRWARRTPGLLRRFVKWAFVPHRLIFWLYRDRRVQELQRAMQAGFAKVAAEKLEALKSELPPADLSEAAWALAYWYRQNGDYQRALDHLLIRRTSDPRVLSDKRHIVVEAEVLLKLGRFDVAHAMVRGAIRRLGEVPELCFCAANVAGERGIDVDQLRLKWLNKPLLAAGLAPVELKDPSAPLTIGNIAAPSAQAHSRSGEAKISVLMPAYNAEQTISTAMDGILSQTWENLELVIVDDGSGDGTWSVIESVARSDPRVVPLRHARNRGAYAARNTALSRALGDLVTVHDSDDWSHPEKLALQAVTLIDSGGVVNLTKQIRVLDSMHVYVKPDGATILNCYPSLMMKKDVFLELGAWDESRMGADGELWERLLIKDARNKAVLYKEVPLSFHLFREESLTASDRTGVGTLYYGPRCQYIGAYNYWHKLELQKEDPDLVVRPGERRFPIPHICKPGPRRRLDYDVLLVSDFSLPGGTTSSNVNMLRAARGLDLRCACFHWPRLEFARRAVNSKIRQLWHEGIADNVVAGESLGCQLVIVNHPPLLNQLPDLLPEVQTRNCVIVVNQTPATRTQRGQRLYRLEHALENAQLAFGVAPKLAPISPVIRRFLSDTNYDLAVTELDWTPLIDSRQYRREGAKVGESRSPIVGRHGRDSPNKWPTDRGVLCQAYCVNTRFEVRILGGAKIAQRILGTIPSNWTVYPFDSIDVPSFLKGLDFFVHYPQEHWIEAFGRAPMEAMATGVPVILPPHFQETFADGAIYAEPTSVPETIENLWSNRAAYETQVQRGFDYVDKICGLSRFEERISPFMSPDQKSTS